jgi:hypothetical protein
VHDKGTNISLIQKMPGQPDIKTTLRYLDKNNKVVLDVIRPMPRADLK